MKLSFKIAIAVVSLVHAIPHIKMLTAEAIVDSAEDKPRREMLPARPLG